MFLEFIPVCQGLNVPTFCYLWGGDGSKAERKVDWEEETAKVSSKGLQ